MTHDLVTPMIMPTNIQMIIVSAIKSVIVIVPVMNSSIIVPLSYNIFSMKAMIIPAKPQNITMIPGVMSLRATFSSPTNDCCDYDGEEG